MHLNASDCTRLHLIASVRVRACQGTGLQGKELATVQLCRLTAEAIKEMAFGNAKIQTAVAESGGIAPLVSMLNSSDAEMQANAAGALANLARNHQINQSAIAKTGAVGPLCTLVREGSAETKDESAMAIWAISTDNAPNKDTIAKLGGIDPLIGLLQNGSSQKSLDCVAGALTSLAHKHLDNRDYIAKRLVNLLGSSSVRSADKAVRVLTTCKAFTHGSSPNQMAISKAGGISPLINWLASTHITACAQAAMAVLSMILHNTSTQSQFAKSDGIPPLINLVKKASPDRRTVHAELAQEYACRALYHLASQADNRALIVDSLVMQPLVRMLTAETECAPELAAVTLVRLSRGNVDVCNDCASKGAIVPLVKLVSSGLHGAQQQAAATLAEIALVSQNRDAIANAGAIEPLIRLMDSSTVGSPETAARVLAHLALEDDKIDDSGSLVARKAKAVTAAKAAAATAAAAATTAAAAAASAGGKPAGAPSVAGSLAEASDAEVLARELTGASERRAQIHVLGGVSRLVAMLDGSLIITVSQSTLRVQAEQAALAKEAMQAKVADADVGAEPLSSSTALEGDLKTSKVRRTSAEVIVEASELEAQLRGTAYRPKSVHKVWSIAPNLIDVDENGRAREQIQIASANKMAMQEQSAAALAELAKVRSQMAIDGL